VSFFTFNLSNQTITAYIPSLKAIICVSRRRHFPL